MTTALFKYILKKNVYIAEIQEIIDFDDVIDYLISKDVIGEEDYLNVWKKKNKVNSLFDILKGKSNKHLKETLAILKDTYGDKLELKLSEINQKIIDSIHQKGGFPKINIYIPRIEQEEHIKSKLTNIRWDNSLVVHGRVGEGKSYLVCQCLKDFDLISEHFNNQLYWINVGECENGSNILQPLTRLSRMVDPKVDSRKKKFYDLNVLIEELAQKFALKKYQNAVVILDNAKSLEIIKEFQRIRCKLLIITYFKNVENSEFVEVNLGFTLNETINLFAQYLGTSSENLSNLYLDDIKDIHELCKGHPTTLSLLAAFLGCKRDHALASKDLWNRIKDKIDKGEIEDLGNYDADIMHTNFSEALGMCINSINSEEMKELYYQLAVFPKDANISTDVLEVYWNKKPEEVWNIMLHFENRSLVNSFYKSNKKVYIYVIHDLFLCYLKNQTKSRKKEFHRKLIESYEKRFKYYDLPDDNYILLFLGYHLKHAEMFDRFEKMLDLKFIDHKIRIVGVNNMEQDLKMFKEEIIGEKPELKKRWEKCWELIRENKNELRQLKTDITQLALPTLIDDAQTLMHSNKLYFSKKYSAGRLKSSSRFSVKEEVTSMAYCFDTNVPKLLIGLKNGDIQLYCPQTGKQFDCYQSHKKRILNLKVSTDNSSFLSVSKDRTVKLWQFFSHRLSLDGDVATSPKCMQDEHFDAFSPGRKHNFKDFFYEEDDDYLISANFSNRYSELRLICTGTSNGKIIIWHAYKREKLCVTTETGFAAENVYFSNDDTKIYFTKQEKIQVYQYEDNNLRYLESITNKEDIRELYVTDRNELIAIGARHVTIYKYLYDEELNVINVYESESDISCSSVAKDKYLAVGVDDKVFLFSISNEFLLDTLKHDRRVMSMAMDILRDDDNITSMISLKFDKNSIYHCNITMEHYEQPRIEQNLVTTYWKNNSPLLAQVLNDNVLEIQSELTSINQTKMPHRITFITFSLCGNSIIYALENGCVEEYQYKVNDCHRELARFEGEVNFLQCIDTNNEAIVAVTGGKRKIYLILEEGPLKNVNWDFEIFQVFPMEQHQLLCIDVAGGIFTVDIDDWMVKLVKYALWGQEVYSSTFCQKKRLLALILTEKVHGINHLEITDLSNSKTILTKQLSDFSPTCCAFSFDGELLVLGSNDGRIMAINIEKNFKVQIFNASNFRIKFVQFSRSHFPVLVVVGREVSWWNLESFGSEHQPDSSSRSQFHYEFWKSRTSHHEVPNMLQTISLYSDAVHFSVSENFETFLVVDDESRIYIFQCFK